MTQKEQFQKKIFANYTANESDSILYVDTTLKPITIYLDVPIRSDLLRIVDMGNASINKITVVSPKLIAGSSKYEITESGTVHSFFYDLLLDTYSVQNLTPVKTESLQNMIVVNQQNYLETICGTIDSSKEYFLDGIIDIGSNSITVPSTGLQIRGYSFALSGLYSNSDTFTMFVDDAFDSGTLLISDISISVLGAGSLVYNLVNDGTGFFVTTGVIYNDCSSLGTLSQFAQGIETNVERKGGNPSLELGGTWGGWRAESTLTRMTSGLSTAPIYKAGALLLFTSRFILDTNTDLATLNSLSDFDSSNFAEPSLFQITNSIITRDGVFNSSDTTITPNITNSSIASDWTNNQGINNTFVGCELEITLESETIIGSQGTFYDILGSWKINAEQHYSQTPGIGNGVEHLGNDPREFLVNYDIVVEGVANKEVAIIFIKDDGSGPLVVSTQVRPINSLVGGRDVGFFNRTFDVFLDKNDKLYAQIANLTDSTNLTVELSSYFLVTAR